MSTTAPEPTRPGVGAENARLRAALGASERARAALVTESGRLRAQASATSEVLRVVAGSGDALTPVDLREVLWRIAAVLARLTEADEANVFWLSRGGAVVFREGVVRAGWQRRSTAGAVSQHHGEAPPDIPVHIASFNRRPAHVADLAAVAPWEGAADYQSWVHYVLEREGYRALLAVPLLRHDTSLGVLEVKRTEPHEYTADEIALLQTFADQAVIAIENARLFAELQERDERRRRELERASAIQQRLLPERVEGWPGVLEMAVRFRPAVETSGDFYDVLPLPAARKGEHEPLQVAVGDVAGKGMSAALVTALARSALHASASVPSAMVTPAGTLRLAGQRLHRDVGSGHFVACALAVVEPPALHHNGPLLRLANAAQVPVLLVRDGRAREIEPSGYRLPLGAEPDGAYKDVEVELRPGDVVVFSSDGLVEAPALAAALVAAHLSPPGQTGELFGFARLSASAAHWAHHAPTAGGVAEGMWSDLTAWCGEESHHDDVTLLVLRVPVRTDADVEARRSPSE